MSHCLNPVNSESYPFAAIVGQPLLKTALLLVAVDRSIGGLLIRGDKGTAKSTAARALADLLPAIDPDRSDDPAPFVELPVGATEDRLLGSIDLEAAVKSGKQELKPGLVAAAHRGILYVDEVNLLPDHLVDSLLDCAASGINRVEREGVSRTHPAEFVLIGTMNPEEGELRPQFLDRFAMVVDVEAPDQAEDRYEVIQRRVLFENDAEAFCLKWKDERDAIGASIERARESLDNASIDHFALAAVSRLCAEMRVKSLRADICMYKVSRALAALAGRERVSADDVRDAARLVLPHRMRAGPFENAQPSEEKLQESLEKALQSSDSSTGHSEASSTSTLEMEAVSGATGGKTSQNAPAEASIPAESIDISVQLKTSRTARQSSGRRSEVERSDRGVLIGVERGNQSGSLAVKETVVSSLLRTGGSLDVSGEDLHTKVRRGKTGNLILFVVDTSGSMAARSRISVVKGAIKELLIDAYQKRDEIGVISFRGESASLNVEPTTRLSSIPSMVEGLTTGGRTPLADAIRLAHSTVSKKLSGKGDGKAGRTPLVVILTDGRNNVPIEDFGEPAESLASIAARYSRSGIRTVVVDTEEGVVRLNRACALASSLGAEYVRLDQFCAENLALTVRSSLDSLGRTRK